MFTVRELHLPRSLGAKLELYPLDALQKPFEYAIKEALFSFPYKPDNYYYVITVREEHATDDFLLIIDPDLLPAENELFVSLINQTPVVKKYSSRLHHDDRVLGTVAHASKANAVDTAPLD